MHALLSLLLVLAATESSPSTVAINRVVDDWHKAAADADETRYFGYAAPEFVFLGTDATERWDLASFRAFAHPYFAKGKAWTFVPRNRHVILSPSGDMAWFDEALDSASYGECRGSGVLRRIGGSWKIAHYNLTIPIPNELAKEFVAAIRLRSAAVPLQDEPMHKLKFENEYVRVFDVLVPAGEHTRFHVHTNDYVFVAIGDATVRSERTDGTSTNLDLKNGEVRFSAPLTHRAVNLGNAPFRNITVEILKSAGAPPEPPSQMPGWSVVLENDRVRIVRQILEPGQSTGLHSHTLMSLGVCVSPARIEYSEPGGRSETADLLPGQFSWHSTARTHSLKNVGKTRFEAVEIEWK